MPQPPCASSVFTSSAAVSPAPTNSTGTSIRWLRFKISRSRKRALTTKINAKIPVITTKRRETTAPTLPKYIRSAIVRMLKKTARKTICAIFHVGKRRNFALGDCRNARKMAGTRI